MRLPRRVPWAAIGELEQVCLWIYADEGDLEAKTLAINRLSAWKAVTPLPHALDSALAILAACVLDASCADTCSTKTYLSLRQAYAAAIIRMVNGLVDPLQSGAYARSIAAIATQLGLPSWLVELRHAGTHEGLPSLELLREACRESLSWLLHNYFHPTLNPSAPVSTSSLSLRPIAPLLKSYKRLMKIVTRDGSLRKRHQDDIDSLLRDIERWITEAKVSAELVISPLGWGFNDNSAATQVDVREKRALELICNALFERGVLVPVSKRKCDASADSFLPTAASLALWTPLLTQLHLAHTTFASIFIGRIISVLLDDFMGSNTDVDVVELGSKSPAGDAIYNEYLARWAAWAAWTWTDEPEHETNLKKEIILQVSPFFIPGHNSGLLEKILNELLKAISLGSRELEECVELLRSNMETIPVQPWKVRDLENMEERLRILATHEFQTSELRGDDSVLGNSAVLPGRVLATGWKLLDEHSKWAPCPIGVYYSNPSAM